jgi:hypothetical protein
VHEVFAVLVLVVVVVAVVFVPPPHPSSTPAPAAARKPMARRRLISLSVFSGDNIPSCETAGRFQAMPRPTLRSSGTALADVVGLDDIDEEFRRGTTALGGNPRACPRNVVV